MKKYSLIAGGLVIVTSIVALASVWHDAPIVDEIPHIGAGYGYIIERSYQFNPEHPPLAKDLAGIALYFRGINTPAAHQAFLAHRNTVNDQWTFGHDLLYKTPNNSADTISLIHAAKIPMLLFFILSAMIIFVWTRQLYDSRAGLLAVFLFSFSPTIIAHARFVTTDIPALFGVLLASYFFIKYLKDPTRYNFWLTAISFGIAMLTKFSTFLLVPYFLGLTILWGLAHQQSFRKHIKLILSTVSIIIIGFVIIVGPVYQFHVLNYESSRQKSDTTELLASADNRTLANTVIWASDKPILRPLAEYGLGLLMVLQRNAGGNRAYFLGDLNNSGVKNYFPIVYSLKEPIPFLILLITAIIIGLSRLGLLREKLSWFLKQYFTQVAMLSWILVYWVMAIYSTVNIGIRHLMPVYGFTFILIAGTLIQSFAYSKKYFKVIMSILLVWYAAEFMFIYPHYLTYFNQFALIRPSYVEGQNGWIRGGHNYVVDSSLDWGQDLWRLGDWVKQNNIHKINVDYFGWADRQYYIGNALNWIESTRYPTKELFIRDNPSGGYIAISATFYQESLATDSHYGWLKQEKPIAFIGNSIFVWYITP